MLKNIKELWISSLPVDPRQRQFAYVIGALDLLTLVLVIGGHMIAGVACFVVMSVVVLVAHRMKKKWRDQATRN